MRYALILAMVVALGAGCRHDKNNPQPSKSSASPAPTVEATPSVIHNKTTWKTVEEFDYAGIATLSQVHFKLELPEGYSDPGDFLRIHIWVKGHPDFVLDNNEGWVEYNNQDEPSEVYKHLRELNLVRSNHVLILPSGRGPSEPPLVLLRSWGYASDAERLHVIGFQPSGAPILLINTELDLIELTDLDGDGRVEIVGRPCLSEAWGNRLLTYDPIHVYHIPYPTTSPAKLSLSLSRSYNLKHYYGWAGPDCSEDLAVVLHPPSGGKPVIMNAKEAQKLIEEKPSQSTK